MRVSSTAVGLGRRRQVCSCGLSVLGVRRETSIGAEDMLAVLAGPAMSGVVSVGMSIHYLPLGVH